MERDLGPEVQPQELAEMIDQHVVGKTISGIKFSKGCVHLQFLDHTEAAFTFTDDVMSLSVSRFIATGSTTGLVQ